MAEKKKPSSPQSRPQPQSQEQIDALDSELQSLQSEASLSDHKQSIADLDAQIGDLPGQIEDLRRRGYRYKAFLEGKATALQAKWRTARAVANREIQQADGELQRMVDEAVEEITALRRKPASSGMIAAAKSKVDHLRARVDAAEDAIYGAYSAVQSALSQTQSQIREVQWMLDHLDQASFPLLAEENPIQAVRAKWWRDGKNKGPSGVLYLTNQRLIFEQREEVATKKVLFVTTEKETLQEMLLEVPIGQLEAVQSTSRGLMGHEDHLDFTFATGAPYADAHFHIDGQDSDFWAGLVNRVRNSDIVRERFYAEGETPEDIERALEESLSNAPEKCTSCGAPFDAPIAKGQRQIQCEYCSTTMRW